TMGPPTSGWSHFAAHRNVMSSTLSKKSLLMSSWKDKLALTAQRNRQEIVKAKLDRREMMRLGLLTVGGALIAKAGLSSRAFGQAAPTLNDPDATLSRVPAS